MVIIIVLTLVLSIFSFPASAGAMSSRSDPPAILNDAPKSVKMTEDSETQYLDLSTIFEDPGNNLTYKILVGTSWELVYKNDFMTMAIKPDDTLELELADNKYGSETITLKTGPSSSGSVIQRLQARTT
jgi:hypothetical protein